MGSRLYRRSVLRGAAASTLALALPKAIAQESAPIHIGLLCIKTGPLASGGIAMEQGLTLFLREHGNRLAGREVELIVSDTAAVRLRRSRKRRNWLNVTRSTSSSGRLRPSRRSPSPITYAMRACRCWALPPPRT